MNFTKRQLEDLETIEYFVPDWGWGDKKDVEITDKDRELFLLYSERGIEPEIKTIGYQKLLEGKSWRGIHIHELYEQGILDRSVPYFTLLGGCCGEKRKWYNPMRYFKGLFRHDPMPRSVVNFMKKEMFKGYDAELIEKVY